MRTIFFLFLLSDLTIASITDGINFDKLDTAKSIPLPNDFLVFPKSLQNFRNQAGKKNKFDYFKKEFIEDNSNFDVHKLEKKMDGLSSFDYCQAQDFSLKAYVLGLTHLSDNLRTYLDFSENQKNLDEVFLKRSQRIMQVCA